MSGLACLLLAALATGDPKAEARPRRPVALTISADGSRLFVANRRSGSVSVVDPSKGRVASESEVGRGLADLAMLPSGRLLAVDRDADALLVLAVVGESVEVEARLPVAADPASVLARPDGSGCVVASSASRRLSVVDLPVDAGGRVAPRLARSIPLPFAPGLLAWAVPGSKLVAAEAAGGRIAVVDSALDRPDSVRPIPAHNIRGLAVGPDGRSLVVAHQAASPLARSSFEDVHWGSLIGNHLRSLALPALLNPGADLLDGSRLVDLGRPGRAAGDPGPLAFGPGGRLAVALGGVGEVALLDAFDAAEPRRVAVGRGPSAVLMTPDGARAFVADALDDAVAVAEVASGSTRVIPLGPPRDLGPVERGERLFADAGLSLDGWMSCRSCHAEGPGAALVLDTLADGGFGAPKRASPLLGVGATGPWTWLGTVDRLEDQVRKSVETTMRGRPPTPEQVDDLTAYLRSLPPPRPLAVDDPGAVARGRAAFLARKCAACHEPPSYTKAGMFDVGLVDEVGNRRFNPPSLRGVGARSPYLHDGRAATLADVFRVHRHPKDSDWSREEADDLAAFLGSL